MLRKRAASRICNHEGGVPHFLREILRTQQVLIAGFSRQVGMTTSRLALIRSLASAGEDADVMDLPRQLGIDASAVTRQVKEMEGEGLARRRADPKDGRRSSVRLSPKGLRLFEEIHERSHEHERGSLFSIISAEEMVVASTVLAKIRTFILGLR
ncbi:MAG: MarR family transcriptional regulator [Candidatus Solibacter sp.]|nr:MarR family transcriptional regulator [Candidatus Solibacter sp.]